MFRNRTVLTAAFVVLALSASAIALSAESLAATGHGAAASRARARAAAAGTTIGARKTRLGVILVNSRGFTVYAFSRDRGRTDECVAIKGCASVWPPVKTSGAPRAGRGVRRSLLGTTRIRGGVQVTYAGHPLYAYTGDGSPGSTSYVGVSAFGGHWPGLRTTGALVK